MSACRSDPWLAKVRSIPLSPVMPEARKHRLTPETLLELPEHPVLSQNSQNLAFLSSSGISVPTDRLGQPLY